MPDIGLLQYQSEGTVPLPVMPSGVEHYEAIRRARKALAVPLPVMPSGVEHVRHGAAGLDAPECPSP